MSCRRATTSSFQAGRRRYDCSSTAAPDPQKDPGMKAAEREKQIREAEELLGDFRLRVGFAKGLYFGHHLGDKLAAYPRPQDDATAMQMEVELRRFCKERIDPVRIDR